MDVRFYQTVNGGDFDNTDGIVKQDSGRYTMIYLALFGGNADDPGGDDRSREWWGNGIEEQPVRQYRSRTQHILQSFAATSGNLRKVQDAVDADLFLLVEQGYVEKPEIYVSIPKVDWVYIKIDTPIETLEYIEEWKGPTS